MNCQPCTTDFIPQTIRLLPDEIIDKICKIFSVELKHIKGKRRDAYIVEARHLVCFVLYSDRYLRLHLTQIGRMLNRHHSTIIHSMRFVSDSMQVDESYRNRVADIYREIYGTTEYFNDFKNEFVEKQNRIKSISSAIIL